MNPNPPRPASPGVLGRQVHVRDVVDSTNRVARDLARRGAPEGTVVVARRQTAGRGRIDRVWHSPEGGLYMSLLLRPAPLLSLRMGLAAARAVERTSGLRPELKWPNDLLAGGKKLGGVLVEAEGPWAVAGVGINVATREFPPELAPLATSLRLLGHRLRVEAVARALLETLEPLYRGPFRLREYEERCSTLGRRVRVETVVGPVEGVARRLDESGALVVETGEGETRVLAGDVVHLR